MKIEILTSLVKFCGDNNLEDFYFFYSAQMDSQNIFPFLCQRLNYEKKGD